MYSSKVYYSKRRAPFKMCEKINMLILKLVQELSNSIDFSKAMTILSSLLFTQVFQPLTFHNKMKSPG